MDKKAYKTISKKCIICGETNYNSLDVHRIKEGKEGGKYEEGNVICCCSNCHRKIHAGEIIIGGWAHSTKGKLLHIKYPDGTENYL